MIVELAAAAVAILLVVAALAAGIALFLRLAPTQADAERDAPKHGAPEHGAPKLGAPVGLICVVALLAGLGAGAALLLAGPDRQAFEPERLFAAGSAWTGGGIATALHLALPGADTLHATLRALLGDGTAAQRGTAWFAAGSLLLGVAIVLRAYAGPQRLRMAFGVVALAAWTALTTRYATHLLAWGLAQLGFWAFLVALVLLQRWRHRTHAAGH